MSTRRFIFFLLSPYTSVLRLTKTIYKGGVIMSKNSNKVSSHTHTKAQLNNYANQKNSNNNAYRANQNNHANQCNPNNKEYTNSRTNNK